MPLVKQSDGSYELTVPLAKDEKILYKYVVDGEWLVNKSEKLGHDDSGIENNILDAKDLVSTKSTGSKIPEAGGLAVGAGAASDVKTTVMPSTEGQQSTLGEPGIFVPKDPEALKAFEEVRDVDPKTLNEPEAETPVLSAEEKKKQKKKLKRSQYKAKKKQQQKAATSSAAEDTSGIEPSPTPEAETLDPAVVGAVGAAGLAGAVGAGAVGAVVTAGAGALLAGSAAADLASGSHEVSTPTESEGVVPGSSKELSGTVPEATVTEEVPSTTEEATEAIPSADKSVSETAPVVAAAVPSTLDPREASTKDVEPIADEEPIATEKSVAAEEPVATEEPVENGKAAAAAAAVPVAATPVVDETAAEPVGEHVAQPIEATPVVAQAEPVSASPEVAKEVDAAPVAKHKPTYSDDEIIIAQGGLSAKEVEAQLAASDINVEEIKPTASEAERLAKEAHLPEQSKPAAKASGKSPTKPASTTASKTGKKEEKKKGGFMAKLKKLFK